MIIHGDTWCYRGRRLPLGICCGAITSAHSIGRRGTMSPCSSLKGMRTRHCSSSPIPKSPSMFTSSMSTKHPMRLSGIDSNVASNCDEHLEQTAARVAADTPLRKRARSPRRVQSDRRAEGIPLVEVVDVEETFRYPIRKPFFRRRKGGQSPGMVTVCTQLTIDRLGRLEVMAKSYRGPISAAMYAGFRDDAAMTTRRVAKSTGYRNFGHRPRR
mmetsp:Transcript_55466/g.166329  ORF Transcript_55466/g.166329 Transcript_55466/m.166329 type:complete len:214 (+) Transcript_55466:735-1376(+)